ncbi:MAG: hypothetical protein ACRDJX_00590 [Solirubrobacteraceae bacterium]
MRRPLTLICVALLALGLTACGSSVSTSGFQGEQHEVAQAIANLQSAATTGEYKKLCGELLSAPVVARLGGAGDCERAVKNQLAEIDNLQVSVQTVRVASDRTSATAAVASVYEGKTRAGKLSLVKEGKHWKISGL